MNFANFRETFVPPRRIIATQHIDHQSHRLAPSPSRGEVRSCEIRGWGSAARRSAPRCDDRRKSVLEAAVRHRAAAPPPRIAGAFIKDHDGDGALRPTNRPAVTERLTACCQRRGVLGVAADVGRSPNNAILPRSRPKPRGDHPGTWPRPRSHVGGVNDMARPPAFGRGTETAGSNPDQLGKCRCRSSTASQVSGAAGRLPMRKNSLAVSSSSS